MSQDEKRRKARPAAEGEGVAEPAVGAADSLNLASSVLNFLSTVIGVGGRLTMKKGGVDAMADAGDSLSGSGADSVKGADGGPPPDSAGDGLTRRPTFEEFVRGQRRGG